VQPLSRWQRSSGSGDVAAEVDEEAETVEKVPPPAEEAMTAGEEVSPTDEVDEEAETVEEVPPPAEEAATTGEEVSPTDEVEEEAEEVPEGEIEEPQPVKKKYRPRSIFGVDSFFEPCFWKPV